MAALPKDAELPGWETGQWVGLTVSACWGEAAEDMAESRWQVRDALRP